MKKPEVNISLRPMTRRLERQMGAWMVGAGAFVVWLGKTNPDSSKLINTATILAGAASVGTGIGTLFPRRPELSATLTTIYSGVEAQRDLEAWGMDISQAGVGVRDRIVAAEDARIALNAQFPLDNRGKL